MFIHTGPVQYEFFVAKYKGELCEIEEIPCSVLKTVWSERACRVAKYSGEFFWIIPKARGSREGYPRCSLKVPLALPTSLYRLV